MQSRHLALAALLSFGCAASGSLVTGCAGSIAPYDEAKEPQRRAALEASLREKLGDAYEMPVPGLTDADLELGKEVYYKSCDACHGPHGQGDGPRRDRMHPAPTNLFAGRTLTAAGELQVIRDGSAGTGMPAFGTLPEGHTLAVYRYVQWLRTNPPPPEDD